MSKFVDERVVEMSFDNKRFESNVKTSMGTIDKLKDSLNFSGTANRLNKELDSVNVNTLSGGILSAKNSFTAFEIAGIAAIANITDKVVNLGIQMVKSLSIDNISSGWGKLETSWKKEDQLKRLGNTQEEVDKSLGILQWYSDETSYSYTSMLDAVTKMVASGMKLEDATKVAIGYSNWAAAEGKSAQEAANLQKQIDQIFQTGFVKRQDWASISNAVMASQEFQEQALLSAVRNGELIKQLDGTFVTTGKSGGLAGLTFSSEQFVNSLTEGLWFTKEVLADVLGGISSATGEYSNYAGAALDIYDIIQDNEDIDTVTEALDLFGDTLDQLEKKWFESAQQAMTFTDVINATKDAVSTGWMSIFQNIFGQVDEAKKLWSGLAYELYDVFMNGILQKIEISSIWGSMGGRNDLFENTEESTGAFWNLFNAIVAIKDLIGGAWQKVFGLSDLEEYDDQVNDIAIKLKTFTENLKEWSEGLIMSSETTEVLTNILTGLFSILKLVGKTVIAVAKGFSPLVEVLKPALGYLLGALGIVGKEITQFSDTTDVFEKITENLRLFFTTVIDFVESLELLKGVRTFIEYFRESLNKVVGDVDTNSVKLVSFRTVIDSIANVFRWFGEIISKYVLPFLSKFFEVLATALDWLVGNIVKLAVSIKGIVIDFNEWFKSNQRIQNGLLKLKNVLDVVGETFKKVVKNIAEFFKSFGNSDMAPVEDFSGEVEEKFTPLKTFVEGLSNLFQGLWHVIKAIVPVVGALFSFIGKALKFVGDKLKAIFTSGDGEVNFAKLFTVGFWAVVAVGIYRFADMLGSITQVFRDAFDSVFDYFNSKAMMQYMEAIKTMAISILLMVGALLILGAMDTDVLKKSMYALGALMAFMVGVLLLMKNLAAFEIKGSLKDMLYKGSKIAEIGSAFTGIAIAILILAYSLKMISKLDPEKMMYSLGIIALMMAMMIGVMKLVGQSEKGVNKAVKSMVKVAISVSLLAKPLKVIGSIDTDTGIRGLIGIASLMAILVLYSRFSKPIEKSQKSIYGLISTAVALNMLIIPLKAFGGMDWTELGKAGAAILGFFIIISGFSKLMNESDVLKLQSLSWSLIKVAISLTLFGLAIRSLGSVNFWDVAQSLLVLFIVLKILSTINKKLSKDLTKPRMENMNRMIWSLIPLSLGMVALGLALRVLGSVNFWSAVQALGTLAIVLVGLAVINKKLSKDLTKPRMENMNRMIWSLIPISLGLVAFGLAIRSMSSIPWTKILSALGALSLILLTLIGLNKILSLAKVNTSSLLGLAISFAVFAVSIFLLMTALTMLVGIMTISAAAFAAGMIAISTAIIIAAPTIMAALWAIIEGILLIVLKSIPLVVGALTTLILEILKAINTIIPPLMETITNLLVGILQTIETIIPQVIQTLLTLLNQLLAAIVTIFPTIINTLVTLFLQLFDALITNIPIFVDKMVDLFVTLLRSLSARLPEVMIELALFIAALADGAVAAIVLLVPRLINAGFDLIIGLLDGIGIAVKERAPELREAIDSFCQNIWDAILLFFGINSPSTKMMEVAGNLISGLVKGLWDGLKGLISNIGQWAGQVMGKIGEFFGTAWQKGKDLINNIGNGAKNVWNSTKNWFSGAADDIGSFFKNTATSMSSKGKDIFNKLKSGASGAWSSVSSWFKTKATDIGESFKNKVASMKTIGGDLINGLKSGLKEAGEKIKGTVENVANKVTGWFKNIFGIKSPSKVFAEMGMFLDLGLAKGIKDHSDSAYDAAEGLGDDTAEGIEKSGLSKVLTDLNKSLESDFDNEVVIRPVLDLSEIQNGKSRLSSMMSDIDSYDISGSNLIANRTRDEINRDSTKFSNNSKDGSGQGVSNSEVINNTFHITGANAKDIADEVSRVLQIQVDRRKAKWAL